MEKHQIESFAIEQSIQLSSRNNKTKTSHQDKWDGLSLGKQGSNAKPRCAANVGLTFAESGPCLNASLLIADSSYAIEICLLQPKVNESLPQLSGSLKLKSTFCCFHLKLFLGSVNAFRRVLVPAVKDVFYRKLKPAVRNKVAINCCYCTCLQVLICEASFTIDCSSAIEGNDFTVE